MGMRAQDEMNSIPHETDVETRLRRALQEEVGPERYDLWLADTTWSFAGDALRIEAAQPFQLTYLQTRLRPAIERIVARHPWESPIPRLSFHLTCSDSPIAIPTPRKGNGVAGRQSGSPAVATEGLEAASIPSTTRRRFARLTDFVTGACNQVGIASARMVMNQPGKLSPLFLYGPTGVGKTHLAQGLWSEFQIARGRGPGAGRHVYVTSEQFTSYFLEALHGKGIPSFRRRYRELDLLVIEDVQFFANKRATLSELQYTIDAVSRDGGQVVLTSDRSPAELSPLGQELTNRFAGGLVARMDPLDLETRRQFVEKLFQQRGLSVAAEVPNALAEKLTDDARKLIGAVNRLHAFSLAKGQPIELSLAIEALDDIFQSATRSVQLFDIERAVCEVFGIVAKELRSDSRARAASQPRMVAMWLARRHTRSALAEIGEFFGRKSHSTVLSAERKVESWVEVRQRIRVSSRECRIDEAIRQVERQLRLG